MRDQKTGERAGYEGPLDLPDDYDDDGDDPQHAPSLADDLVALFEDGKTYVQAELAFQKSRANYTANRLKSAIALGLGAFGVLHLALIALTVGVVIALMPLVGPWLATGIVSVVLVLVGIVLLRMLKRRIDDIRSAFSDDGDD